VDKIQRLTGASQVAASVVSFSARTLHVSLAACRESSRPYGKRAIRPRDVRLAFSPRLSKSPRLYLHSGFGQRSPTKYRPHCGHSLRGSGFGLLPLSAVLSGIFPIVFPHGNEKIRGPPASQDRARMRIAPRQTKTGDTVRHRRVQHALGITAPCDKQHERAST
jgi:hypothetical protein